MAASTGAVHGKLDGWPTSPQPRELGRRSGVNAALLAVCETGETCRSCVNLCHGIADEAKDTAQWPDTLHVMETSSLETKAGRFPTFMRLFCWRNVRFALIGLASLITLFALYHAEENWRGKRAWTKYRAAMEAKGAVFDLKMLIPPPVPDEQNFAMTPLLKPLLDLNPEGTVDAKANAVLWRDMDGFKRANAVQAADARPLQKEPSNDAWRLGRRIDLIEWQAYYRSSTNYPYWPESRTPAEDVLRALSKFDAEIEELRTASQRPFSRFNVEYEKDNPAWINVPHLSVVKNVVRLARLRALAELAGGGTDQAFADVNLMFRLADSIKDEPMLISHLVRIACLEMAVQVIWEGLADHRWQASQLAEWQASLQRFDMLAETKHCFHGEHAFGNRIIEWLRRNPAMLPMISDLNMDELDRPLAARLAFSLIPRGWFYFEQLNYNRLFDEFILAKLPDDAAGLDLHKAQAKAEQMDGVLADLSRSGRAIFGHYVLSRLLLPAINRIIARSTAAQTTTKLAVVALALERHRLAHGSYPGSLETLAPEFMAVVPVDPVTQQPFHYRRTDDGQFVLYSIGWNLQDDGGKLAVRETKQQDIENGDWVWPSPTPAK